MGPTYSVLSKELTFATHPGMNCRHRIDMMNPKTQSVCKKGISWKMMEIGGKGTMSIERMAPIMI